MPSPSPSLPQLTLIALALVGTTSTAGHAQAPPAPPPPASPVRVAVVGFTGDLPGNVLSELASQIRDSMMRQADPQALMIVPRNEMAEVYRIRGGACHPEDTACIAEVSESWYGRLFVRGVVRNTSDGIVVTATLESIRLGVVVAAQTPLAKGRDVAVAVPLLVRELLDGERKFRETGRAQLPQPAAAAAAPAAPVDSPARCRCLAISSTYVPGELVANGDGLRFDSDGTSAVKLSWRYAWDKVGRVDATAHGVNPALKLASKAGDELIVSFHLGNERDRCLQEIGKRRR